MICIVASDVNMFFYDQVFERILRAYATKLLAKLVLTEKFIYYSCIFETELFIYLDSC